MIINLTYEANADSAPAGFKPCIQAAVDFLSARFQGGSPVNIQCGFGTVAGGSLGGALGASVFPNITNKTYSQLRTAIISKARTANAVVAAASLPASDPNGGTLTFPRSHAKNLGLLAPDSSTDGWFGISSSATLDFSTVNGATPVGFSCFSVACHEITECLGRILISTTVPGPYSALNLFSYSALNTRVWLGTDAHSFSIDSGATLLKSFATSGDPGDWSAGGDSCSANATQNVAGPWSATDDIVMDALGYIAGPPFSMRMTWS